MIASTVILSSTYKKCRAYDMLNRRILWIGVLRVQ